MTLPSVFLSLEAFHTAFTEGLQRLIADRGLGAYILALANANFDPALFTRLREALAEGFTWQCADLDARKQDGSLEKLPPDDLAVFYQLRELGIENLESARFRQIGPWEAQFNALRALRPPRAAGTVISRLDAPFDPAGFNFNRPFLRKESLWTGDLLGREVELLYNKFPFIELHGLLVPERERQSPQFLSEDAHAFAWQLSEALGHNLPGVGLAYNAYGAYASVNHLHFQLFARARPLPVESAEWAHNGGPIEYPASCRVFAQADAAYAFIQSLHRIATPYNLLYRPGRVYCLPRRFQGSAALAAWSNGHAWYEMCGGTVFSSIAHFSQVDADMIAGELARLRPDSAG